MLISVVSIPGELYKSFGNLVHGLHWFHLCINVGIHSDKHDLETKTKRGFEEGLMINLKNQILG